MKFLKAGKYHLGAIALISLMFVFSVIIRRDNLSAPIGRHHEWITAHTLITCEIWSENGGPSAWHFSPVYTYPGKGNLNRNLLGGVIDEEGYVYYVSYPPFAFLFAYYATSVLGEPDVDSIRTVNLFIHFLCSLLVYLLAVLLASPEKRKYLSVAGLMAAFLYLFSAGNLWIHGNLYFADTLVMPLVIVVLVLVVIIYQKIYQREWLVFSALFVVLFLATYTEWLGLFLAFYCGVSFFILFLFSREKRFLKVFLVCAAASALALGITVYQYSSIAGWEKLRAVSERKYDERSGHQVGSNSPVEFSLESEAAYQFMIGKISAQYKMTENLVGIAGIALAVFLLIPNARRRIVIFKPHLLILLLLLLAILTHYYLFFNFNSMHDFSALKTGFFMMLVILICISLIESTLKFSGEIILFLVCSILAFTKVFESITRYKNATPLSEVNWDVIHTARIIRENQDPDMAVFANMNWTPELSYQSHHHVYPVKDTSEIGNFMKFFKNDHARFCFHVNGKLHEIFEYEMVNGKLINITKIPQSGN